MGIRQSSWIVQSMSYANGMLGPLLSTIFSYTLLQVNEGYTAFGTAHKSMTRIQNASSQIPDVIKTAVYTIIKGNPSEVSFKLT